MNHRFLVFVLATLPLVTHKITVSAYPPECPDVSPCHCYLENDQPAFVIECSGETIENGTQLQAIFAQNFEANFTRVSFRSIGFALPADLLSGKSVTFLSVDCSIYGLPATIMIHPSAFKDVAVQKFHLGYCKLIDSSVEFLSSFQSIVKLELAQVSMSEVPVIPPIPSLQDVWIDGSSSFSRWEPWTSTPSITRIGLIDMPQDRVMSLMESFSQYVLESLYLDFDHLETIPDEIKDQTHLEAVYLGWNELEELDKGTFTFESSPLLVELTGNPLKTIQPGALNGDFSQTAIQLNYVKLETFDEDVFGPILSQMYENPGNISLEGVKFKCECDIAWVVRDNRQFLADLPDARCSNGTKFQDLDPNGLSHCPGTITTTTPKTTTTTLATTTEASAAKNYATVILVVLSSFLITL